MKRRSWQSTLPPIGHLITYRCWFEVVVSCYATFLLENTQRRIIDRSRNKVVTETTFNSHDVAFVWDSPRNPKSTITVLAIIDLNYERVDILGGSFHQGTECLYVLVPLKHHHRVDAPPKSGPMVNVR